MNKNEEPLVTIVTITFNLIESERKETFRQCLESVYNQTYKNIEHIIIDGGSKDGTLNLIKEYCNKGWIKYISEPDDGIYNAMNKGIDMAKGKYIAFLNSDDYYHGNRGIEDTVEALEKNNADFSYAPVIIEDENGNSDVKHPHHKPNIKSVFYTMPFCHQTMFTKRDVLLKEKGFDELFRSAGDYDLVMRLCLNCYKSVFVDNIFTTYRWGGFSISSNELSIREVALLYFKNYSQLSNITRKECEKIYCTGYNNIPLNLAKKLKHCKDYFDYPNYLEVNSQINKIKLKKADFCNKFIFLFFSPKKILKKYKNKLLNGKFRQPIRKAWYFIRGKKIQ